MREPEYTCPRIDTCIDQLVSIENFALGDPEDFNPDTFSEMCDELNRQIEEVRKANAQLRDWGKHYEAHSEELETQVSTLEDEVSSLERKLDDALSEVRSLEQELADV